MKAIGLIYISVFWLILSGFWLLIVLKQMGSYAKLAKRALETEMPIMVQVSHLGFFFFFGCQICLFLASVWIYMVDRSYNCDYKKVFVPPITILHFFMFWWLQYIYIYKCVFFSLIYCALGGAMKLCRRKWMLFFMVKVRFFLFWQIQELVRGAKNAVSLAQVCFSISQRSCCYVALYLYGEMVSGVFSFSNV